MTIPNWLIWVILIIFIYFAVKDNEKHPITKMFNWIFGKIKGE